MQVIGIALAISVLVIGASLYILACIKYPPTLLLAVVAYSMISKSASVVYLEAVPTYIIEVALASRDINASMRHILYNLFIFSSALAIISLLVKRGSRVVCARKRLFGTREMDSELRLAIIVVSILLGIQIVNALLSPPYALPGMSINRQQFWANIRSPLVADLIGVLVIFVPAISGASLGYAKVTGNRAFRSYSIRLILAYCFYFLITGARFNGSLLALLFWLAPYWSILWMFGKSPKLQRMGLVVSIAILLFLFVGYLEIADRGISQMAGSTWNGFLYRIFALQGDVYFTADLKAQEGHRASIALLTQGMERTIMEYMPAQLAQSYIHKGVNLAGSLPGNSILVFGFWIGILPMIAYSIILGLAAGMYGYFIVTGRFILLIPSSYICLWTYSGYTQGSFSIFMDYKFPIALIIIVLWLLLPKARPSRIPASTRRQAIGEGRG